jgi:UDP-N-acetylmuramoyl-L-alanyl-D-glutamate--2,6-diaminopimelate ligase
MPKKSVQKLLQGIEFAGDRDVQVTGIQIDSRKVSRGDAFVAITGFETDGHQYIPQAIANGAQAVIHEKPAGAHDVPMFQVSNSRRALSRMAAAWYKFPANQLKMIGITGTNGKTTITTILRNIFEAANIAGGSVGTFGYTIKGEMHTTDLTTPDSLELHGYFREMADAGVELVAMEVSSHALALDRTADIPFATAIFTNLGRDHFDFHKTRDAYREAKGRLFSELEHDSKAILNMDSPDFQWFAEASAGHVDTYSLENRNADYYFRDYQTNFKSSHGTIQTPQGTLEIETDLLGRYNLLNILASVAAARVHEIPDEDIVLGITHCSTVPGRLEMVATPHEFPEVYVDYAHTPDALESVLRELNHLKDAVLEPRKIILVFGCGGNRDREKRPQMGKIAEQFADKIIVTNDNPRDENPLIIIKEIQEGMIRPDVIIEQDRRKAIFTALEIAEPDDIVLVAGKGHEDYQIIKGKKYHFDDKEVVNEAVGILLYR